MLQLQPFTTLMLAGAGAVLLCAPGLAQDYSEDPTYGSVRLSAGFVPDPHSVTLTAGGSIRAQDRFSECRGYIANAPDYSLYYEAGTMGLYFSVDSDRDTTLVINGPDTRWYCDDDGADEPLNPLVHFTNPQSGRYDIWVGTYGDSMASATLFISELGEATDSGGLNASGGGVNLALMAREGTYSLTGGYLPDPWRLNVTAGGALSASTAISSQCRGNVTSEPTVEIQYSGSGPLYFYTGGSVDTTLAVNLPNGSWVCDDDGSQHGLNAALTANGGSGTYDVYVGTFGSNIANTSLMVSEIRIDHGSMSK
ncbi:MAG: hypothetical protein AAFX09_06000 [Pseudomonadota bacterium]